VTPPPAFPRRVQEREGPLRHCYWNPCAGGQYQKTVGCRIYVRVMAGSATHGIDPFGSALQTVRDALGQVSEKPTWSISESELPDLIKSADAAAAAVAELKCRLLAEADGRNLAD
jgi:hypothetical protein